MGRLGRAAVEAAKNGDMAAVRIVMDRVYPARKSRPIHIELPPVADAIGVSAALDAVFVSSVERRAPLGRGRGAHRPA
jgi:hypothetical protein